ncbi:pyridoxal phosphate-dependent transferase [Aspergillus avenaceus]|uniref:Pyridoxal phosphate-dependent transferase n=1 Tax=Aspergillus avenaceus TaxID=36643 RepID=A0A5N6U8U0_ASPAV|nr:pyridoxal phosphate-dependent transferase [Aspergillus avenaceus]
MATVLPAGNTRSVLHSTPFPLVLKSGSGASVTSLDGREYTDFVSDYSAGLYGHSHPVITKAVAEALATGFSLGGVTEKEAQLGEILCNRFQSIEQVRFCNSGTEANTYALGTALAFNGRKKVLVFESGYHGGTLNFAPATVNSLNLPHDFVIGAYNDIESTRSLADERIGAILVEPMQSAGGMRPSSKEFLQFPRETATRVGAVLIFDEVVTSRFHFHGMQGAWGVRPDMTTLGKYLGGGFPFGAFGGRADIMNQFDPEEAGAQCLQHAGTFNNNIFTMTSAVAAADLVTEEALVRLNQLGNRVREQGNKMAQRAGFGGISFTGYGSAIGVHFHGSEESVLLHAFYFYLLRHGITIGRRGFISLNLQHTDAHVDHLIRAIRGFINEYGSL